MRRLLIALLLAIVVASGAAWLAGHDGRLVVDWLGYRIETSLAVLVLAFSLVFLAGIGVTRLAIFLRRDLPFSPKKRAERRTARGYEALNRAIVALAAGDRREARKLTRKATALLPPQPLTHVIAAEAARLAEDHDAAHRHYEALAADDKAAFLGLRGLIAEARAEARWDEARRLARQAAALRPKSAWAQKTLFDLDVRATDWEAALVSLEAAQKAGAFDEEAARRHRAALLYCRAVEADLAGDGTGARDLARKALALRPGFTPAALLAARHLVAAGKRTAAERVLRRAWDAAPHPALVAPYLALDPQESGHARYKRVESLVARRREHVESRIALAEAALAAKRFDVAHEVLRGGPLEEDERLPGLRLRLAEVEGDDRAIRHWRDAAARARAHAAWVCAGCGAERALWTATCPACGRFDSHVWSGGAASLRRVADTPAEPPALFDGSAAGKAEATG